jgi:hypothetical protein
LLVLHREGLIASLVSLEHEGFAVSGQEYALRRDVIAIHDLAGGEAATAQVAELELSDALKIALTHQ